MDTLHRNISSFFNELLIDLDCQYDTRSYIVGIFGRYQTTASDLSQDSITLTFAQARYNQDFSIYQNLGDWLFFVNTMAPEHLQFASKDYYDTIAKLSYYSCYRLINRQWKLFEELADNFQSLEKQVKQRLPRLNTQTSRDTWIVPYGGQFPGDF